MAEQQQQEGRDAQALLTGISQAIQGKFVANQSLMSFEEYMREFLAHPRRHSRSTAQYLRDLFDHYGSDMVQTPAGELRRFRLFDMPFNGGRDRLVSHEWAQNEMYEALGNFTRERRITRLLLLHGPNGSAKSSFINCIAHALEDYSRLPEGALYRFNWVFPTEKISRAAIGFGERAASDAREGRKFETYAHLSDLEIDAKLVEELRDSPLLLLPHEQRRAMLLEIFGARAREGVDDEEAFVLSDYLFDGDLSHKSRRILDALLVSYGGDYSEVLKHVQVERFFISRRYRCGATVIEPQLRVDAASRQVTMDRSLNSLPTSLQNQTLFELQGGLVDGNRGMVAFNDLLKRPLELNKYLLSTSEDGRAALEHATLYLDTFLIASANEAYLEAFKGTPDYMSFKGRLELVRMPYMLDYRVEREIYNQLLAETNLTRPIAPNTTEFAALWAVLTRLVQPNPERYPEEIRDVIKQLTPLEKAQLYAEQRLPEGLTSEQGKVMQASIDLLYEEGVQRSDYEGRHGISPREMKNVLLRAAQRPNHDCLSPLALFEVLREVVRDASVHPFLRLDAEGAFRKPAAFIDLVREHYIERLDVEVRACMGLVDDAKYVEYFGRYVTTVSHWLKGEKLYNRITGRSEAPSEAFLEEVEKTLGVTGEPRGFRNDIISKVGAFRVDNPEADINYEAIFPGRFAALKESFFEERRRKLQRISKHLLWYIQGDAGSLTPTDLEQVEITLENMETLHGYCRACAQEAISFLIVERYS